MTLLSRRLSLLDEDDDELELDDELEELLVRDPDDELLSEVLLFENEILVCVLQVYFEVFYLPLLLDTDPRRFISLVRCVLRLLLLSFDWTEDGDSDRMRLALDKIIVKMMFWKSYYEITHIILKFFWDKQSE